MHLLLQLETNGDHALAGHFLYAFTGFPLSHVGNNILQTVVDGGKLLTDEQWNLLSNSPYKVTFIAPARELPVQDTPQSI